MKLVFIGLGNMGAPMARNLLKAGFDVYGFNRSKEKERSFIEDGGKAGYSLAELVRLADVVMTCLPMPEDVEQIYLGEAGVFAEGKSGLVAIDFSTVSPGQSKELAEAAAARGMHYLDAPVSGGTAGAKEGTLTVMVGGERSVFEQVQNVLGAVGSRTSYIGPSGSGSVVKLLNQLMVGIHTEAVSESFRLAEEAGVELSVLYDILSNSFAQSRIMDRHYRQYMAKEQYDAGFALKLLHKDMRLVRQMAGAYGLALPLGAEVLDILHRVKETTYSELDMSALFAYYQRAQGAGQKPEQKQRYFAVLLPMRDEEKSRQYRPQHLAYLEEMRRNNRIFVNGRFVDGAGGLVIYKAASMDEVRAIVENDPYVRLGARTYEIYEWDLVL